MTRTGGILRGAVWTAGMKVVVAGLSFGFFAVVARQWGAQRLGELSLVYACYVISQQLPMLGLHYPLIRDVAQRPDAVRGLIRSIAAIGVVAAAALAITLSIGVARLYNDDLRTPLLLVGLSLFPGIVTGIAESVLVGREQLARVAQISVSETLIRTVVWLLVVYAGGNLVALCAVLLVGRVLVAAVYLTTVDDLSVSLRWWQSSWPEVAAQLRLSPPFLCILVLTACINRIDFFVVARFGGTGSLGLYSTPYRVYEGLLMIPQSVSVALSPRLARDFAEPHAVADGAADEEVRPAVDREALVHVISRLAVLLGAPCAIVLAAIAEPLIRVVFGDSFIHSAPVLMWLAGVPILASIDQCLGILLLVTHRQRADLGVLVASSIVYILLLLLLVPRFGPTGAAAATCCAAVVQLSVRYVTVRRLVGIRSLAVDVLRPAAATAATVAMLLVLRNHVSLGALLGIVGATYAACSLLFRAVTVEELRQVWMAIGQMATRLRTPSGVQVGP